MPHDVPVTLALLVLTLAAALAAVVAARRLVAAHAGVVAEPASPSVASPQAAPNARWISGAIVLGTLALLSYRWAVGDGRWELLAHVDGLLAISGMLAASAWYVEGRPRLRGLAAFILGLLTLMLAWAICAAAWTYDPFDLQRLDPVWEGLHLGGVYLGTLSAAIAAAAGAAYLFSHRRLKSRRPPVRDERLASLETLEGVIVRTATLGFVLLTLGLVAGVVVQTGVAERATVLGPQWWRSPKVLLALAAWLAYAVLMNARRAAAFRGPYAAWLSIAGMVLLLSVYGVVTALPDDAPASAPTHRAVAPAEGGPR